MAKKNPYRFNLQFDQNDVNHQEAVDMLTAEGRKAAQFIVNAVLHYKYCENAAKIGIDQNKLLIRQIQDTVKDTLESILSNTHIRSVPAPEQKKKLRHSAEISMEDIEVSEEDTEAILDSLSVFMDK